MKILASDKIDKERLGRIASDLENVMRRLKAFSFWAETIRETDDKELIKVALEAMEEVIPETKTSLRDFRYEVLSDVSTKCISLGLL